MELSLLTKNLKRIPFGSAPRSCIICGDTASGCHYDVPSCKGCKAFFRRAVLTKRKMVCKNNGDCKREMNLHKRVFCRRCRLECCLAAGMKLELIGINEKIKAAEKPPETLSTIEDVMAQFIERLLLVDDAHNRIRFSRYSPNPRDGRTMDEMIASSSKLSHDYGPMPGWPCQQKPEMSWDRPETYPIEVHILYRIPLSTCHKVSGENVKSWLYADLIYSMEYLKTLPFFCQLSNRDKRALLRLNAFSCGSITMAFFSYERKSSCSLYPDGTRPRNGYFPPEAPIERRFHTETISKLMELNVDRKEYVLLKAIAACDPANVYLSNEGQVMASKERERYAKILFSYMMARRSIEKAPSDYANLLNLVALQENLARKQQELHLLIRALGLKQETSPCELLEEVVKA